MTAQSPAQSLHKAAQGLAHTVCPPLKGDTLCALGAETLCTSAPETSATRIKSTGGENKRLPLTAILEPDAFALQWAHAVRDRFPNAKPLWGTSSVGEVGTDPNRYAVPWRLWWEGLV